MPCLKIKILFRPYRESNVPPPPTPPSKPSRPAPTASDFYYKDVVETTPAPAAYTRTTTTESSDKPYASSENFPTVPNILKFYHSEASSPSEPFYRPVEEVSNEVEEGASNYGFEDGSQFFNDSEIFPQFIKNTVVEFSSPDGEDGKQSQFHSSTNSILLPIIISCNKKRKL